MEELNNGLKVLKLMKQVMSSMRHNTVHHFREMQLTAPQGMLVGTLARFGKMKVSDLGERLELSNSTVSGIIDRLEKQGLVERIRSEEDRRVVYVDVTPDFRKNFHEHFSETGKIFESVMKKATPEETAAIIKGLEILKKLIESNKEEENER